LFLTAGSLVAASFAYGWNVYPWNAVEVRSGENARFRQLFPNPDTIYTDQSSAIFYYGDNNNKQWTFQDRFLINNQRIVEYRVDGQSGHPVRLFRNKNQPWFELTNPETYQVLAAMMREKKLKSVVLFFTSVSWNEEGTSILDERVHALAPLAGLECGRYELGTTYAFIVLKMK
jgi:hypothetical protein